MVLLAGADGGLDDPATTFVDAARSCQSSPLIRHLYILNVVLPETIWGLVKSPFIENRIGWKVLALTTGVLCCYTALSVVA